PVVAFGVEGDPFRPDVEFGADPRPEIAALGGVLDQARAGGAADPDVPVGGDGDAAEIPGEERGADVDGGVQVLDHLLEAGRPHGHAVIAAEPDVAGERPVEHRDDAVAAPQDVPALGIEIAGRRGEVVMEAVERAAAQADAVDVAALGDLGWIVEGVVVGKEALVAHVDFEVFAAGDGEDGVGEEAILLGEELPGLRAAAQEQKRLEVRGPDVAAPVRAHAPHPAADPLVGAPAPEVLAELDGREDLAPAVASGAALTPFAARAALAGITAGAALRDDGIEGFHGVVATGAQDEGEGNQPEPTGPPSHRQPSHPCAGGSPAPETRGW